MVQVRFEPTSPSQAKLSLTLFTSGRPTHPRPGNHATEWFRLGVTSTAAPTLESLAYFDSQQSWIRNHASLCRISSSALPILLLLILLLIPLLILLLLILLL